MLKLRKILLSNIPYYAILVIVLLITIIRLFIPKTSMYTENITEITGTIIDITKKDEQVKLTVQGKEKVLVTYYLKEKEQFDYALGDKIKALGTMKKPKKNTTENLFNYQAYLEHKNIYFILESNSIKRVTKNKNIYYFLKQKLINYLDNPYLSTFIIGDKSNISSSATTSYQKNGISHLFAISGMHITLLSSIILKILKKLKVRETKRYFITSIILLLYLSITGLSASILRGVLFFILFSINKIYYLYIKPTNLFIITVTISLLINENYIYDIGFWYSYSISLALIIMAPYIKSKNYIISLLKTSVIAFLVSIPISLYNFYEINFLSIIYNLIFVPFVSYIVFPLSLITFICPGILPIFSFTTLILEELSILLSKINILTISLPRLNISIYILYTLFIIITFLGIIKRNKKYLYPLIVLIIIHYIYPYFTKETYIKMIDVGQGDSILIHSNNETVLIDTGGIISYKSSEAAYSIVTRTTIPLLKSLGIRKIDKLILTHGDYDHMGEAKYLIENFKVETVLINEGNINYLEKELLSLTSNVKVGEEGTTISCGDINLVQLNSDLTDENDSSQIYYAKYNDTTLLLTGDASIKSEELLLNNYDLGHIDILKVGHHGSKTSTSEHLLQATSPTLALISCGIDNKFDHPHKSVIDLLEKYGVNYLITAEEGTITIDLNTLEVN